MAKKKEQVKEKPLSAELRIKEAARKVFTQKGYAAARTRDIAEEAGMNLALLNYYYRSKEKLFELVMLESIKDFFLGLTGILNNPDTELGEKLELLADSYISMLIREPNFPLFMLSELQANPDKLIELTGTKDFMNKSVFFQQMAVHLKKNKMNFSPMHVVMNMIGLTVFPFIGKPMIKLMSGIKDKEFLQLMEERRKLIPVWMKAMFKIN